jgi:membrane protease YdiL (CAAX protease family)
VPDTSLAWRRIASFLALVIAFSGIVDAVIIHIGTVGAGNGLYAGALMWSPALAALATCKITGLPLASLGLRWPAWRHIFAAWLVPLGYTVVAYTIVWVSGLGGVPDPERVDHVAKVFGMTGWPAALVLIVHGMVAGVFAMPSAVAHGLGEEIGWRGLLVPQLSKVMGFGGVVLVSGAIWTAYHIPVLLFADYNSGTPWWFGLSCFAVLVFSGGAIFAASRLRSGSVWPAAILHGSHNLFIQGVFTPMTRDTGHTKWIIDEFGVALAVVITVFAIVICRGMSRTAREFRASAAAG